MVLTMTLFYGILFTLLGLIFGSFLNVVGMRLPKGESFANDRSGCPNCGHELKFYELVPVFSYVIQGGKCRGCKQHISIQYPLVELATGVLFLGSYLKFGLSPSLAVSLLLISMLVVVFIADIHYMLIPDKVLLFFAPFLAIATIVARPDALFDPLLGALIGGGITFVIVALTGGMGAGDMKLFFVLGLVFGPGLTLLALGTSFLVGTIVGGIGMMLGKVKRGKPFPFGPSIVVAALLVHYFGQPVVDWYITLL